MDLVERQRRLGQRDLAILNAEVDQRSKSTGLAYVLWFFAGPFGVHNFYLGKLAWGLLYLLLLGGSFAALIGALWPRVGPGAPDDTTAATAAALVGGAALAVLGLLLLWDLFTLPMQVSAHQRRLKETLLRRLEK